MRVGTQASLFLRRVLLMARYRAIELLGYALAALGIVIGGWAAITYALVSS